MHSPFPWRIREPLGDGKPWRIFAVARNIALVIAEEDDEGRDNAELILRACHAHDDLLAALPASWRRAPVPWIGWTWPTSRNGG